MIDVMVPLDEIEESGRRLRLRQLEERKKPPLPIAIPVRQQRLLRAVRHRPVLRSALKELIGTPPHPQDVDTLASRGLITRAGDLLTITEAGRAALQNLNRVGV